MTDDIVQRIRSEADMASRTGQAAALHKIADDLAARAGEAVDREALREAVLSRWWMDQTGPDADRWETLDAEERENVAENSYADTFLAAVLDFLAARGAAAPTEVEWGVRHSTRKAERIIRTDGQEEAVGVAEATGGVVIQRTVPEWREVQS